MFYPKLWGEPLVNPSFLMYLCQRNRNHGNSKMKRDVNPSLPNFCITACNKR